MDSAFSDVYKHCMSQSFVDEEMHVLQQKLPLRQQLLMTAEALSNSMSTAAAAGSVA